MAIKTTRIKAPQAPELKTYNLSDQVDGTTNTFELPFTVSNQQNIDYLLLDGQMLRNDPRKTYYTISHNGDILVTKFTPAAGSTLQFVSTDNSAGAESATKRDVEEAQAAAIAESKEYTDVLINTEQAERGEKDEELEGLINEEKDKRISDIASANNKIDENSADIRSLKSATSTLESGLAEEQSTRETAVNEINDKLDINVLTDIHIDSTASTTVVKLNETKTNIGTGVISPDEVLFPVANETQAGIMNSSTFESVKQNKENIESLMKGAATTNDLGEEPTQEEILNAWKAASGKETPLNSASLWDNVNHKKYTFYETHNEWVLTQDGLGGEGIEINQWTNEAAGIAKGSTNAGQVFAESDGTGSVNGWDDLRSDATVALEKATNNETEIAKKQNKLTAGEGIKIEGDTISNTRVSAEWGKITGEITDQEDLKAELDKKIETGDYAEVERIEPSISTEMIKDKAITNSKLATNSVKWLNLDSRSVREDTIDKTKLAPAIILWEKIGNGSSTSSSFSNIDIPFSSLVWDAVQGKTKYHKVVLEIICEPDGSTDNYGLKALNSSDQAIGTFQAGTECWNNDGAFIRRNGNEIVAAKAIGANSVYIKAEFFLPMKINYMPFLAHGFGGTDNNTGVQNFNGRVNSAPDGVSKLRFGLFNGGTFKLQNYYKIRLFGYREE